MSKEAMKLALEALEEIHPGNMTPIAEEAWNKAITALREALAEQPAQQQEPVCWVCNGTGVELDDANTKTPCPNCAEQPAQQEPVAFIDMREWPPIRWRDGMVRKDVEPFDGQGLFFAPPAQRKPLTDEQLNVAWHDRWTNSSLPNTPYGCFVGGIRLAEAAHNIKENT